MYKIQIVAEEDINRYCHVIRQVFDFYIAADYSALGVKYFYQYISQKSMVKRFKNKEKYTHIAAYDHNELIGIIETRDQNHISLLFVKREYQKKGIAKRLIHEAFKSYLYDITVNSSPYASSIYEKLGFHKISGEIISEGITFIPMIREVEKLRENK